MGALLGGFLVAMIGARWLRRVRLRSKGRLLAQGEAQGEAWDGQRWRVGERWL